MSELSENYRKIVQNVLAASPLIPVITIQRLSDALPLCEALINGGINVLEITLRTPHGLAAIEQARKAFPEAYVGAGTVTSLEQYRQVEQADAKFAISPGVTEALLHFGLTSSVPLLPGISTTSELMMGYALGYREFKFFPAEVAGGIPALKAFSGPFADVAFCPTGGIKPETAGDYLALTNVSAVGGTWLTPPDLVADQNWSAITSIARDSLDRLREMA